MLKRIEDRQALLKSLNDAKTLGLPVSGSDLTKAQNDLAAAQKDWQALPNSGSDVLVAICQGIVSPPSLIDKGINEAFKALGQNLGTFNDNNLPFSSSREPNKADDNELVLLEVEALLKAK